MAESQELKLIGGKGHKVGCMCKMCLRIRHNWAKGQEKSAKGFQMKVSGPKLKGSIPIKREFLWGVGYRRVIGIDPLSDLLVCLNSDLLFFFLGFTHIPYP